MKFIACNISLHVFDVWVTLSLVLRIQLQYVHNSRFFFRQRERFRRWQSFGLSLKTCVWRAKVVVRFSLKIVVIRLKTRH